MIHFHLYHVSITLYIYRYNNDDSTYEVFDTLYSEVIDELEVSFLSNVKQNFPQKTFDYRFRHVLLPKLTENLRQRYGGKTGSKDYSFRVTFSPDTVKEENWRNIILNMEQMCFDHAKNSNFPRNMRRLIDERNSLEFLYRTSDEFATKWKIKYGLYTVCTLYTNWLSLNIYLI